MTSRGGYRPNTISNVNNAEESAHRKKGRAGPSSSAFSQEEETTSMASSTGSTPPYPATYNRSGEVTQAPAELFRKDLISAMKLPDSEPLAPDDFWVITDHWKQEWERGVQVPVNPNSLPAPSYIHIPDRRKSNGNFKLPKHKLIRLSKDDFFKMEHHYLSNAFTLAESCCMYDMDEVDHVWLDNLNQIRLASGRPTISDSQLEKAIEDLEKKCWRVVQDKVKKAIAATTTPLEFDENVVCDVCRSPESEDGNEMVFCDACNICVHQACYGIQHIPDGSWLCRTCEYGIKPECLLCPNKNGAMKSTRCGTKWAHVSCALWIPEVSIGCVERMEPITKISSIPASRWALQCILCRERVGACVQCSVRSCKVAYHVTCAFKHNLDMRAIIDNETPSGNPGSTPSQDDNMVKLRSYCLTHSQMNRNNGNSSDESDNEGKRKRGTMHPDDRKNMHLTKVRQFEADFESLMSVDAVLEQWTSSYENGGFSLDESAVRALFNMWILKRTANLYRPLLAPDQSWSGTANAQNISQDDKLAMFVQLRQDLERVRNLCYMVSKREKLGRAFLRMREQTFQLQMSVLSDTSITLTKEEREAVMAANHSGTLYDCAYSHPDFAQYPDYETLLTLVGGPVEETSDTKKSVPPNGRIYGKKESYKKRKNGIILSDADLTTDTSSLEDFDVQQLSKPAGVSSRRNNIYSSEDDSDVPTKKFELPKVNSLLKDSEKKNSVATKRKLPTEEIPPIIEKRLRRNHGAVTPPSTSVVKQESIEGVPQREAAKKATKSLLRNLENDKNTRHQVASTLPVNFRPEKNGLRPPELDREETATGDSGKNCVVSIVPQRMAAKMAIRQLKNGLIKDASPPPPLLQPSNIPKSSGTTRDRRRQISSSSGSDSATGSSASSGESSSSSSSGSSSDSSSYDSSSDSDTDSDASPPKLSAVKSEPPELKNDIAPPILTRSAPSSDESVEERKIKILAERDVPSSTVEVKSPVRRAIGKKSSPIEIAEPKVEPKIISPVCSVESTKGISSVFSPTYAFKDSSSIASTDSPADRGLHTDEEFASPIARQLPTLRLQPEPIITKEETTRETMNLVEKLRMGMAMKQGPSSPLADSNKDDAILSASPSKVELSKSSSDESSQRPDSTTMLSSDSGITEADASEVDVAGAENVDEIDNDVVTSDICDGEIDNDVVTSDICDKGVNAVMRNSCHGEIDNEVVTSDICDGEVDNSVMPSDICDSEIDNDVVTKDIYASEATLVCSTSTSVQPSTADLDDERWADSVILPSKRSDCSSPGVGVGDDLPTLENELPSQSQPNSAIFFDTFSYPTPAPTFMPFSSAGGALYASVPSGTYQPSFTTQFTNTQDALEEALNIATQAFSSTPQQSFILTPDYQNANFPLSNAAQFLQSANIIPRVATPNNWDAVSIMQPMLHSPIISSQSLAFTNVQQPTTFTAVTHQTPLASQNNAIQPLLPLAGNVTQTQPNLLSGINATNASTRNNINYASDKSFTSISQTQQFPYSSPQFPLSMDQNSNINNALKTPNMILSSSAQLPQSIDDSAVKYSTATTMPECRLNNATNIGQLPASSDSKVKEKINSDLSSYGESKFTKEKINLKSASPLMPTSPSSVTHKSSISDTSQLERKGADLKLSVQPTLVNSIQPKSAEISDSESRSRGAIINSICKESRTTADSKSDKLISPVSSAHAKPKITANASILSTRLQSKAAENIISTMPALATPSQVAFVSGKADITQNVVPVLSAKNSKISEEFVGSKLATSYSSLHPTVSTIAETKVQDHVIDSLTSISESKNLKMLEDLANSTSIVESKITKSDNAVCSLEKPAPFKSPISVPPSPAMISPKISTHLLSAAADAAVAESILIGNKISANRSSQNANNDNKSNNNNNSVNNVTAEKIPKITIKLKEPPDKSPLIEIRSVRSSSRLSSVQSPATVPLPSPSPVKENKPKSRRGKAAAPKNGQTKRRVRNKRFDDFDNPLAGTPYDFDEFDDEFGESSLENWKKMREKSKVVETPVRESTPPPRSPASPVRSPSPKISHKIKKQRSVRTPRRTPKHDYVVVPPDPVVEEDDATLPDDSTFVPEPSEEPEETPNITSAASDGGESTVTTNDSMIDLHSEEMSVEGSVASAPTFQEFVSPKLPCVVPAAMGSDSDRGVNQLKLKIKGPFSDADYTHKRAYPLHEFNYQQPPPTPPPSTSAVNARMRKKELLRQYCQQDLGVSPIATASTLTKFNLSTATRPSTVITIPKAVASGIPTRDDYKAFSVDADKKKYPFKEPQLRCELEHSSTDDKDKNSEDCPPPKLKIKILAVKSEENSLEESSSQIDKNLRLRPPKKRHCEELINETSAAPTLEELRADSMNFRYKVMNEFKVRKSDKEDEIASSPKKKKKKKKSKKRKRKLSSSEEEEDNLPQVTSIISNANDGMAPKLIIKYGGGEKYRKKKYWEEGPSLADKQRDQTPTHSPHDGQNSEQNESGGICTSKISPIRLKLSRCKEGYKTSAPNMDSISQLSLIKS